MLFLWCAVLLSTHALFLVHTLDCKTDTEYEWPPSTPTLCCKKCKPGQYMKRRCSKDSTTICAQCGPDYYTDHYNNEMGCSRCLQCTKENMVYKKNCTTSTNSVCGCKSGYQCDGSTCEHCIAIPTTTTTTAATTVLEKTMAEPIDSVWISLSLTCACVCILLTCFILISRPTPACGWIMSASSECFWPRKKGSANSSECTEEDEEEVPMPVQEVYGKTEWQHEV